MQHVLVAPDALRTVRSLVTLGQVVGTGDPLLVFTRTGAGADGESVSAAIDLDRPRADLDEVAQRHLLTRDEGRPAAVAKRHKQGRRTARENIADLVDAGSFVEYGALAIAAQRSRRSEEDLIANTPADGLVAGLATIGADRFGQAAAEAVVVSYDYTVLAGTQGMRNHAKTDRVFDLAARKRLPVVLFAEGGGGRPGDTDVGGHAGLDVPTFRVLAGLSGRVPLVSIVSGRCFAGNAALAGVCDVIIATPDANIGMGGPAMIEGGGLGVYPPEAIGPIDVQRHNGVVRLVARDEAHAVSLAKQYLSYFQGSGDDWEAPDPRLARHVVPQNRLRAYDVHRAIESIVDVGSVLELRPDYGVGIVTALVRVEGVAYGLIANSSHHLGGAIDAEAADKAGDFLRPVRVVSAAGDLAVRHPRIHGRAGRGKRSRRPPVRPDVRPRRAADRAARNDHLAQGLRAGRDGHGRRLVPRAAVHGRLAHRRDRRHGPGRRCAAWVQQGAGRRGRSGRTPEAVRSSRRGGLPARQGAAVGHHVRARRRHRPRRLPGLDYQAPGTLRVDSLLCVTGTAADARQTSGAARHAARTGVLAAGAATDARDAALAARTAAGAVVHAAGAAVAVGVTAAAARVVLEDNVRRCRAGHRWSSRKSVGRGRRRGGYRCSDSPGHNQWFHEV